MSEYEKIVKKVKKNPKDYSKYTGYQEKDYLPYPCVGFSTPAIHIGSEPEQIHGSVNVPIHLTSTYAQKSPGVPYSKFDYTRCGGPTREAFERCMAEIEHGKHAIAYSAGVAANAAIFHLLNPGDHIVCCDDVYGGTQRYLRNYSMTKHNISVDFIDSTNAENVKKALKNNTKVIWLETPSNPTMKVSDIKKIAQIGHQFKEDIIVVVDNTFMTPYLQSPLLLGADIVTHSVSKYIGGHSDVIMGVTVTNDEKLNNGMFQAAKSFGGNPSPFDCYLAIRGLKSLEARMKIHCYNAYCLAHYLKDNKHVDKVYFGGLEDSQGKEIIQKQQRGYGGMVSFAMKGGLEHGKKFLENLKVFTLAESLGGVESLAELPAVMTHGSVPEEHRNELGITGGFIRLSVGIENINDIIQDIEDSLEFAFSSQ